MPSSLTDEQTETRPMTLTLPQPHVPEVPAYTLPAAAARIGATLHVVTLLLAEREDIASRIFRAGTTRMVPSDLLPELQAALAARTGETSPMQGGTVGPVS
jgi:hypothetical protein